MAGAETFGARIKRVRLAAGLTQRKLADTVKVGTHHTSKIEADREKPSDELIVRLAEVLGLDSDELFLAARLLPSELAEEMASDPAGALQYFRTMQSD